jgi:hypothetical protein
MQIGSKVYIVLEKQTVASGYIEAINGVPEGCECHFQPCVEGTAVIEKFEILDNKYQDIDLPRPGGSGGTRKGKVRDLLNSRYLFLLEEISILPPVNHKKKKGQEDHNLHLQSKKKRNKRDEEDVVILSGDELGDKGDVDDDGSTLNEEEIVHLMKNIC